MVVVQNLIFNHNSSCFERGTLRAEDAQGTPTQSKQVYEDELCARRARYEDPADYKAELDYIEELFTPLVLKCKVLKSKPCNLNLVPQVQTPHPALSAAFSSSSCCQNHKP